MIALRPTRGMAAPSRAEHRPRTTWLIAVLAAAPFPLSLPRAPGAEAYRNGPAGGKRKAVEITVRAGFEGRLPLRGWVPVWVRIAAPKEGFLGLCEIRCAGACVRRPVDVAPRTTADVFLPVPIHRAPSSMGIAPIGGTVPLDEPAIWLGLNARLLDAKERVRAERALQVKGLPPGSTPVVALFGPKGGLGETRRRGGRKDAAWRPLSIASFPRAWYALDALDLLVLRAGSPGVETACAAPMLRDWVLAGGLCAVVLPRGSGGVGPGIQGLVGAEVRGSWEADIGAVREALRASTLFTEIAAPGGRRGAPRTGATAEAGGDEIPVCRLAPIDAVPLASAAADRPLVIGRALGAGVVLTFAFDPERISRDSPWPSLCGMPRVGGGGIGQVPAASAQAFKLGRARSTALRKILTTYRGFTPLPLWVVSAIFIAYLLLIGVAERWGLRAIGRPGWTWWTLPAIALAFFAGIFEITAYRRAGGIEARAVGLVVVETASGRAALRARATIFSPGTLRCTVSTPLREGVLRLAGGAREIDFLAMLSGTAEETLELRPGEGAALTDVVFRSSSVRAFELDWVGPARDLIDLRIEEPGVLRNAGSATLEAVWIPADGGLRRLPSLPPGGRLDLRAARERSGGAPDAAGPDAERGPRIRSDPPSPGRDRGPHLFREASRHFLDEVRVHGIPGVRALLRALGRTDVDGPTPLSGACGERGRRRSIFALARRTADLLRIDGKAVRTEAALLVQVVLP